MTSILVVDDHSVVRMGLVSLLTRAGGLKVVGEAARADEAVKMALDLKPDLVLMDVRLPDGSGIECCRSIRAERPETRVLMLTSYDDKDAAVASVIAGASGYLLKQVEPEQLLRAIQLVAAGHSLLDPSVTRSVLETLRQREGEAELTERERVVLALVGEGLTNREIGQRIFLSEKTVRNYVSSILMKLDMQNRTQAAAFVNRKRRLDGGEQD